MPDYFAVASFFPQVLLPLLLLGDPCILCTCVRELVRACVSASICLDKSGIPGAQHV